MEPKTKIKLALGTGTLAIILLLGLLLGFLLFVTINMPGK